MRDLRSEEYPGYEWVATIKGETFEIIAHVEELFRKEAISGYSPGTGGLGAGVLVRYDQAERARAILRADDFLKGRWVFLETPNDTVHL
jgi:hypothetical protein